MPIALADILRAAGEPTRLRILNLLRQGRICVCDLQAVLGAPQPTVSRHLAALRHAGLVEDERDGPRVIYSLAPAAAPPLKALYDLLDKCCPDERLLQKDLHNLQRALKRKGLTTTVGPAPNETEISSGGG